MSGRKRYAINPARQANCPRCGAVSGFPCINVVGNDRGYPKGKYHKERLIAFEGLKAGPIASSLEEWLQMVCPGANLDNLMLTARFAIQMAEQYASWKLLEADNEGV